jgi:acyl-homoserine lactone acylase PvdQ
VAALNYFYWRACMAVLDDVTPEQVRDVWEAVEAGERLRPEQSWVLVLALKKAIEMMHERHGTTDIAYGEVFVVGRGGASYPGRAGFFMTRAPVGDEDAARLLLAPLRLMEYGDPDERGNRFGWWGPRNLSFVIFPVDGNGPIRSYACLGFGQSPDPDSPHHSDQAKLFSQHRLRSTYWEPDELREHTVSTTTLAALVES